MGYWKSKVLPKIKKVFEKNGSAKKAAAAEAIKSFDESKEEINKQFEEKKSELQPKVVEIYEASSTEIKTLVKEPKEAGLKKHSVAVDKFLEELVKIEFPGSKPVSEASTKFGAALVPGPVFFVFEKVSSFVVTEEKVEKVEEGPTAAAETATATTTTTTSGEETTAKEKEIVIEEEKKEETVVEKKEEEVKDEKITSEEKPVEVVKEEKTTTSEEKPVEAAPEPPKP